MRIAVDGAHGTGKTTLLEALSTHIPSWNIIEEGARELARDFGVSSTEDWESLYQDEGRHRKFLLALVRRQEERERTQPFLSDGSIYRIFAYARTAAIDIPSGPLLRARYDLIAYCPLDFPIKKDGLRFTHARESVDDELRKIIVAFHRGPLILIRGSVSERLAKILPLIGH